MLLLVGENGAFPFLLFYEKGPRKSAVHVADAGREKEKPKKGREAPPDPLAHRKEKEDGVESALFFLPAVKGGEAWEEGKEEERT